MTKNFRDDTIALILMSLTNSTLWNEYNETATIISRTKGVWCSRYLRASKWKTTTVMGCQRVPRALFSRSLYLFPRFSRNHLSDFSVSISLFVYSLLHTRVGDSVTVSTLNFVESWIIVEIWKIESFGVKLLSIFSPNVLN